ncbi:MAG: NAD+ synthase [Sedimentisphaerales bacterium]|nr:NAD+ synthase [Sedimentisphaerales bacterium]
MRFALAQINSVVGDLQGNAEKILQFYNKAVEGKAELIIFPELALCGYPPEDLLYKKHFLEENLQIMQELAKNITKGTIIAGFAEPRGYHCCNSAAIITEGKISTIYRKGLLPNYGVFDEARYFDPGDKPVAIEIGGIKCAITICRDIWEIDWLSKFLSKLGKFELLVNISSSPFSLDKLPLRQSVIEDVVNEFAACVCYCNMVGGQDELVFDGRSVIVDSEGNPIAQAKGFEEDLIFADITKEDDSIKIECSATAPGQTEKIEDIYNALILGTRDYTIKNGFKKVLLGISGGIDSSVVAAVAAEALGKENVIGVTMPSKFNTNETKSDAAKLAENLGIDFLTIPIQNTLEEFDISLMQVKGWDNKGIAYENLQARIRGTILMTLSNQFDALVLTTGNKSETAVGYSTLYGDTAGGFAVIKDVLKTMVYELAKYINSKAQKEIIPKTVIKRAPSAELRENQKDSDSLPDYDLLDKILAGYVEQDKSIQQLIDSHLPAEQVLKTARLVDRNEYKRRQSPPGVKITTKAFGKDRRLPITNRYIPK